jgi:hypothetical protein
MWLGVSNLKQSKKMSRNQKGVAYKKRGRGTGYKAGMERFCGVEFKALRLLDEVREACDKWLEANEDRGSNWDSFQYGKNAKK